MTYTTESDVEVKFEVHQIPLSKSFPKFSDYDRVQEMVSESITVVKCKAIAHVVYKHTI